MNYSHALHIIQLVSGYWDIKSYYKYSGHMARSIVQMDVNYIFLLHILWILWLYNIIQYLLKFAIIYPCHQNCYNFHPLLRFYTTEVTWYYGPTFPFLIVSQLAKLVSILGPIQLTVYLGPNLVMYVGVYSVTWHVIIDSSIHRVK